MDVFLHNTNIYAKQYHGKRKTGKDNVRKKQQMKRLSSKAKRNFSASMPQEGDQGPQAFSLMCSAGQLLQQLSMQCLVVEIWPESMELALEQILF